MKRKHTLREHSFLKTALTAVLFVLAFVQFSCKDPNYIDETEIDPHAQVRITLNSADTVNLAIKGDAVISVIGKSKWKEVRKLADAKLEKKNGYEFDKWTLKNNPNEPPIDDNYEFTKDVSIYAHTKPVVTITLSTDNALAKIKAEASVIKVKQGGSWQSILPAAAAAVQPNNGYYISEWRKDNSSGTVLSGDFTFTNDATVYAVIQTASSGKIYITASGDEGINVKAQEAFETDINAKWGATVKALAEAKVEPKKGYKIKEWRLNGVNGQILQDSHTFTVSSLVYAVSVKEGNEPQPKEITITVTGDSNIIVKTPNTFKAQKGALWKTVKAEAEKIASAKTGFRISQWSLGAGGTALTPDTPLNEAITIVYAVSSANTPAPDNKVEVIVTGDSGITVNGSGKFKVEQGLKWKNIKAQAQAQITVKSGFTLKEWKNGQSGSVLAEETAVTGSVFEVYAVTKSNTPPPQEDVTVIVTGDQFVSLKNPNVNSFKAKKGSKWAAAKDKALALITFTGGASLKEWKIGSSGGNSISDDTIINTEGFTVFAVTQGGSSGGGGGGTGDHVLFYSTHTSNPTAGTVTAVIEGTGKAVSSGTTLPAGTRVIVSAKAKSADYFVERWYGFNNNEPHYGEFQVRVTMDKAYTITAKFIESYFNINSRGQIYIKGQKPLTENRIIIPARIGDQDVLDLYPSSNIEFHRYWNQSSYPIEEVVMADSDICYTKATVIPHRTFISLPHLKKVHLSRKVQYLQDSCFQDCGKLETVTGVGAVIGIYRQAFINCFALKNFGGLTPTFPKVQSIGQYAFQNCKEMALKFVLPYSIASIADYAFSYCPRTIIDLTLIDKNRAAVLTISNGAFGRSVEPNSLCNEVHIKKGNNVLKTKILNSQYLEGRIEEVN